MSSDPVAEHWHHLSVAQAAELLEIDPEEGLDLFDVKRRRERYGANELSPRKGPGPLIRFLLQFNDPLLYILMAAGAVTLYLREWIDAAVIFGVVVLNAVIGYVQEAKAVEALKALAQTMTTEATVVRAGERTTVPATELVPGDVVILQSGDKVPADLRLAQTRDLQIDESALTGESLPVEKDGHAVPRETPLADRRCVAYASSLVTYGAGRGIVVATGDDTEVGRISELIAQAEALQTPLTRKLTQFSKMLLIIILAVGAVTFGVGLLRGESVVDMFQAAIALAVAAVPEGLPAAVTITLAIGVSRMARRRAIIRKLPAVETLGSTSVICTDKTGTLTENQMTVQRIVAGGRLYCVEGTGYEPLGAIAPCDDGERAPAEADGSSAAADRPDADEALLECLRAGLLCNDSRAVEEEGRWQAQGDPTEVALEVAARKAGLRRDEEERRRARRDAIPFESRHQYMATLHDDGGDRCVVYLKGSAESVLTRCSGGLGPDGSSADLDRRVVAQQVERLAAEGLRVLALARGEMPAGSEQLRHEDVRRGLTFLGLQAMIDPPRPEAIRAVAACRSAGVAVKMITGDHAVTAAAIAARMGIGGAGERRDGDAGDGGQSFATASVAANGSPAGDDPTGEPVLTGQELERRHDSE
ncbi:MAG: HAD-IC family P-type ATPase, partial [Actinobacteria bacterium]|nr:HAD-IC family P-type ATPase [Actinomycetota bacterium]